VSIEPENDTGPAQDLQPRLTTPDPTVGPTSSEIAASLRRDAVLLRKQADQAEGLRKHNAARAQALANAADAQASGQEVRNGHAPIAASIWAPVEVLVET